MFERFSVRARQALMVARIEAGRVGAERIDSEHLLIGILSVDPELTNRLDASVEVSELRAQCGRWCQASDPIPTSRDLPVASDLRGVFTGAESIADARQCREIRTEHLLFSLREEPCHAAQVIGDWGIPAQQFSALVANVNCAEPQEGSAAFQESMKAIFEAH